MKLKTFSASSAEIAPPYGEANTFIGPLPVSIDLRLRNGNRHGFSYAFLFDVEYEASGVVRLTFGGKRIEIRGRNLAEIYERFLTHSVGYVEESASSLPSLSGKQPFIESIVISTLDD